jgi:hypothetical protein
MLRSILNLKLKFVSAIYFLWVALSLPALPHIAAAQCSPNSAYNPDRVPWSELSFRGKTFLGRVFVDVELTFVSSEQAQGLLIASPNGVPVSFESAKVGLISVHRIIDSTFGSDITEEDKVLFNPMQASALGRIRWRRGQDDFIKQYRFTNIGIYRIQKTPADKKEVQQPPDKWTKNKANFYGHDAKQLGCSVVSERSILLYAIFAAPRLLDQQAVSVCVFGKRQLHRVQMRAGDVQPLKVKYVEKKQDAEVAKEGSIDAQKIFFEIQTLKSDLSTVENFSFLGLRQNIAVFIDPASRQPLQISGRISKLGTIDLKLSEVRLRD